MDIDPQNAGMIVWKLAAYMDENQVTRYSLQKESGVPMNTIRAMYAGTTTRADFPVLDKVLLTLEKLTGKPAGLHDLLEWKKDGD